MHIQPLHNTHKGNDSRQDGSEEVRGKYSLTFATLCFLVGRADIALEVALLSRLCNKECKIMLK